MWTEYLWKKQILKTQSPREGQSATQLFGGSSRLLIEAFAFQREMETPPIAEAAKITLLHSSLQWLDRPIAPVL